MERAFALLPTAPTHDSGKIRDGTNYNSALYDLAEEKGEHVRLDWKGEEPQSNMHDVRAAAAPLAPRSKWTTLFFVPFLFKKAYQSTGTGEPDQPNHT